MMRVFCGLTFATMLVAGTGCGHDEPRGAAESDTALGDVPEAGQVPGRGRIDRGGGATAGGSLPNSKTNYTQPNTGVQQKEK